MANWLANLPWWIKGPAFLAGSLMSAFSSKLPDGLQTAGLYLGITLAFVAASATLWHCIDLSRIKHGKPRLRLEPFYLIVLGLVIAALGVGWQIYRAGSLSGVLAAQSATTVTVTANKIPAPAPEVVANIKAPLEAEIDNLKKQVATLTDPKRPTTRLANVTPDGPTRITAYDLRRRQEALDELYSCLENDIYPTYSKINILSTRWDAEVKQSGSRIFAQHLRELLDPLNEGFGKLDKIVKKYGTLKDIEPLADWNYSPIIIQTGVLLQYLINLPDTSTPGYIETTEQLRNWKQVIPLFFKWIKGTEQSIIKKRSDYDSFEVVHEIR